jgi:hypothetical protein
MNHDSREFWRGLLFIVLHPIQWVRNILNRGGVDR